MKTCSECKYWSGDCCICKDRIEAVGYSKVRKPEVFGCIYFDQKKEPEPEMKPCPNCNHPDVIRTTRPSGWSFVECVGCCLRGPIEKTSELSVEKWNSITMGDE